MLRLFLSTLVGMVAVLPAAAEVLPFPSGLRTEDIDTGDATIQQLFLNRNEQESVFFSEDFINVFEAQSQDWAGASIMAPQPNLEPSST